MVVRPPAEGPMILAVGFLNGEVVDAGITPPHEACGVEFPVFVAVGAEPVAGIVVPLVGKADSDAMAVEGP
jgi:hypothetical protein